MILEITIKSVHFSSQEKFRFVQTFMFTIDDIMILLASSLFPLWFSHSKYFTVFSHQLCADHSITVLFLANVKGILRSRYVCVLVVK